MANTNQNIKRLFSNVGEPVSAFYQRLEIGQFGYHVDTNVVVVRTGESTFQEVGKENFSNFLDLLDTFSSYTGNGGKALVVNGTEDGVGVADFPEASKYVPLCGVFENKDYITKIDDNTIAITAGSGKIRKADLSEHDVSWNATSSQSVTVADGELYWCVLKWNVGETALEFSLLSVAPSTLDEFEQNILIGRVWKTGTTLNVSGRHILLSVDPQISRTEVWLNPSGNVSVDLSYSTLDNGLLSLSSGELTRWPVVELDTYHHVWQYSGDSSVSSAWVHLQGASTYTVYSDDSTGSTNSDIRTLADIYDENGNVGLVANNKFVAHLVGVYAGSEERVIFLGQTTYDSVSEAKNGVNTGELVLSPWASDLSQISKIGYVILQKGSRDYSTATFVPYSDGGGAGSSTSLFALNFRFSRQGFVGTYSGGDIDLPYVSWMEDEATLTFGDNYGVATTVPSTATVLTAQAGNISAGNGFLPYIKINGVKTAISGTEISSTNLIQTYVLNNISLQAEDSVIFGLTRNSGTGTISIEEPTITAYVRTAGA